MKSSARIIGATELGEEAQELENAAKKGDMDYIGKHHAAFLEKYMCFREPLMKVFENTEDVSKKPEAEPELMVAVFEELRSAADDMDCDRLFGIFKEMEEYRIPQKDNELWKKLKCASDNYDYDAVIQLLEQIK